MPWDGFHASTQNEKNTRALPDIYRDEAKFKAGADRFQQAVDKLVSASKGGDEASTKAAIGEVGKACGGCHDTFRAK
jgi:cytochrome c556